MYFFSQGQSSLVLSHLMKKASPSYKVVPSDGVGGASAHGLFAIVKGVLWSCWSLVVSTAQIFLMFVYFYVGILNIHQLNVFQDLSSQNLT